jgi:hypothetical protein
MDEKFWVYNPDILIKNYYKIVPTREMSRVEQLNTVTRFLVYFILLCIIFDIQSNFVILLFVLVIIIAVFYFIYKSDENGIVKDLIREGENRAEKFMLSDEDRGCDTCGKDQTINYPILNIYDKTKDKVLKGVAESDKDIIIESGYIDADGNYKLGPNYSNIDLKEYNEQSKKNKKVSWEKSQIFNEKNCRKPTADNPFANVVFSDYLDAANLPEPCNIDDKDVQDQMRNLYNSSIFRNLDDVWERQNSQRMFYSVPIQTIPNAQTEFANWLYKTGPTCHENSQNCTYYQSPQMTSPRY